MCTNKQSLQRCLLAHTMSAKDYADVSQPLSVLCSAEESASN